MKSLRLIMKLGIVVVSVFLLSSIISFGQSDKVSSIYFDRGVQKYLKGDLDGFIEDLEKALEFNPKYEKAKTFLVKVLV